MPAPEEQARAAMDRLKAAGVASEIDAQLVAGRGRVRLVGQLVANLWGGTPLDAIGFVTHGADQVRMVEPTYLADAPPIPIDGVKTEEQLAARAAKAHDAWVAALTDLDVELARLKLGHKLHGSRGMYVASRTIGPATVELGLRPDGMVEVLAVGGTPAAAWASEARVFPFVKTWTLAQLEAAISERLAKAGAAGPQTIVVRFRDKGHLKAHFETIKKGGLFVAFDGALARGAVVRLVLELPGAGRSADVDGEVVVNRAKEDAAKGGRAPGVGVKLGARAAEFLKAIEEFLSRA